MKVHGPKRSLLFVFYLKLKNFLLISYIAMSLYEIMEMGCHDDPDHICGMWIRIHTMLSISKAERATVEEQLQQKEDQIQQKDARIQQKNIQIQRQVAELQQKDAQIHQKDTEMNSVQENLKVLNFIVCNVCMNFVIQSILPMYTEAAC